MPKFQVVSGFHVDEEGRKYGKGEEVESPHDLTATFRGKFTKVEPTIADFRPLQAGAMATSDRPLTAPQTAPVAPQPGGPAIASQPAETDGAGSPGNFGEDVTARFPKAIEQDFKVFKRGSKFYVADSDTPTKALNPDGAKRDEVDAIIDKALKPE
jgi:hypothetical protein